jgi:LPXTG-site transpeptidase (sortase) family protein
MKWRPRPSQLAIGAGLVVLVLGGVLVAGPWFVAARWQSSPEAARAERNAEAPTPVWVTPVPTAAQAVRAVAVATPTPPPPVVAPPVVAPPPTAEPLLSQPIAVNARIVAQPTPTPLPPSALRLGDASFTFDNPPQPGAHAHLDLTVHNPTDSSGGAVSLSLPTSWLAGYALDTVTPAPMDGTQSDGSLRLTFDGPPAGADLDITLQFVTTDEVIDSPALTVLDAEGRLVGQAHPATQAPPARPGPIYSIDIPRLKLHAGVVPVDWEPPLFVIGQVRTSAWVTLGNSVLVGHVRGAAGYNVFIHLDQLQTGDEIVANSRGQAYNFVVSQTQVLPEDDTSPTDSTRAARLTLMTCAGDWNPLTQDYSDRLWVTAEPQPGATPPPVPATPLREPDRSPARLAPPTETAPRAETARS